MYIEKIDERYYQNIREELEEKYDKKEHRRANVRKAVRIILFFLIILGSIALFYFTYMVAYDMPTQPGDKTEIVFQIDEGMTIEQVEEQLLSSKLVSSLPILRIREKIFQANYKAGSYKLKRSYNTEKIINILSGVEYEE